ncbi:hypothetical protein ACSBLW_13175 [Thioclava sp. FR2]|uniref:hypothetical protein n=1 Tax=Thioclava sp. FR2 TaxID=3445780 RepID=UPI003EBEE6FB
MTPDRLVRFFLEPGLRESAEAGEHNFLNKVSGVLRENGFHIDYCGDDPAAVDLALKDDGSFSLFHMRHPVGPRSLVFRRVYHYPFWAIEPSAERWHWHTARCPFLPDQIDPDEAARFVRFWRKKLFGRAQPCPTGDGFLYLPLQGQLTEHRSFQSCSPVEMVRRVLELDARPVVAALHPKESYTEEDHAALAELGAQHDRLTLTTGGMDRYLPACDAVITQNSSVAFNGYFLGKPAVLFADIDFHHIALDARTDPQAAVQTLAAHNPDYERYIFWFWQIMSINAGRPEAEEAIRRSLQRARWPIA